ncbi:FAD/NAD(P)-binding protein [Streptomyces sp. Je 1-369]|uniref:FAD/NAD(P)-binding protein n=1 Tax=Streptomyces sp. Je 1-369 TaxID=2966192 RepID=UPI0022864504|nr:FAD/NAD(P)-binding protein [Streptomyces sp. Je 1-369]WAL93037.1 FAD/NAD(P)-binding protein [Streptomyces sp. Je 1-369]WAL99943.1 FAD/NAD(P)-binding protein [Streptomyces sp. Je 1-369]
MPTGPLAQHTAVCLVGAGPRGFSVLERICAQERKSPLWERVSVHVVDPAPPGAGRVWRPAQSPHLLMNTVASQVTVYTDDSVSIRGPLEEGPSLYEWARALGRGALAPGPATPCDADVLGEARALGPDSYPTRALYGRYLGWAFAQVVADAPAHVVIRVHRVRAVALTDEAEGGVEGAGEGAGAVRGAGAQTVVLEDGTRLAGLSAVVLAQGHLPVRPGEQEGRLARFAARHGLLYVAPANPADVDLSPIAPGQDVLLRGLGLNFFDYMSLLTQGRGGRFERAGRRLVYRASGREPRLHAGSRRGIPYHSRGDNEKGAYGRYRPRLLTAGHVAALRAPGRGPLGFRSDLWPLISKEVRCVYYEALLAGRGVAPGVVARFGADFLAAAPGRAEEGVLAAAGIGAQARFDWEVLARPYGSQVFADAAQFRSWLRGHLEEDVAQARRGNVRGPLKAALDVLRDLRNEIRLAVDHGGLTGASHRSELEGWYTPLNAYLSIGPPAGRVEEMLALMEAGVLDVALPGIRVTVAEGSTGGEGAGFVGSSALVPGIRVRASALIEARLPEMDLRRTDDPLLRRLLASGQCRPYRVQGHETGGLAVTRSFHLLDAGGVAHRRRLAYGVPTESVHWVTAAGIRPGVGSVTLEDSDAIAGAVLALPAPPRTVPRPGCEGVQS